MKAITLPSTNNIDDLHVAIWEPDTEVKAIVQISHGMIEYIERYDEFAKFLNSKSFLVIGNDHLGHGHTAKTDADLGYFGKGKSKTVVDDLHEVTKYAKSTYPNTPYILFGHSMGSFMARRYLSTYGDELDAAIICGTGYTPSALLKAGICLANIAALIKGGRHRSKHLKDLAFGAYNNRIKNPKTPSDWLSVNEENVAKYRNDKFCSYDFTTNGYQGLFEVINFIQKKKNIAKIPKTLPILLIAGNEDPVGDYSEGVKKVHKIYKSNGLNIKTILIPGKRHEILNEDDRENTFNIIYTWIQNAIN